MSFYICRNKSCLNFNKEEIVTRETFKYVNGVMIGMNAKCPICGKERDYVNHDADVPLSEKNIGFGIYSAKNPEEKREILRKRSHEHFEKHIKEKKEYLNQEVIKEMNQLKKGNT